MSLSDPKILVVEDEPNQVELIEFNLNSQGYEVVVARDGEEALNLAEEENPDLILQLSDSAKKLIDEQEKGSKKSNYIPLARRHNKLHAISWLHKNCPEMSDAQIASLIGTTKSTIQKVKDKTHWNYSKIRPQDPVILDLCPQEKFNKFLAKAKEKFEK